MGNRRKLAVLFCLGLALLGLGFPGVGMAAKGDGKTQVGDSAVEARPANSRIATENALPGTDEWSDVGHHDMSKLSAFTGAVSVNAGEALNVHVKSTGSSLSAKLYRLGYYQDHGARFYWERTNIATGSQPACTRDKDTGLVQCPWSPTFAVPTDPGWISGIYLLRLDSNQGYRFFVYFIVRNDGYPADILVMEPTKTNQAYNRYGCESLYFSGTATASNNQCDGVVSNGNSNRTRGHKVSFDRPYKGGAGTGGLFTHDVEMVRWLEASGYDVNYISDVDRVANPSILLGHKAYLVMGHDEYWTWQEFDAVENAVANGVNVLFLSANEAYWRIRMESSSLGPNRIITGYKDATLDPIKSGPDGPTVTFRNLGRSENRLLGTGYMSYYDDALYNMPWQPTVDASKWYWDCTGLRTGDSVNNIVGEEWNAILYNYNSVTPQGIELLSEGVATSDRGVPYPQNTTIYTAPSGAMVFAAGSIHWSWGLMDHSYRNQVFQSYAVSNDADARIQQLTANILDRFAGYWDGTPRGCTGQEFYKTGPRPTRTPMPVPPTATGTLPTLPPTRTSTPTSQTGGSTATPAGTATNTSIPANTGTATRTATPFPTNTATQTPVPGGACTVTLAATDLPKDIRDLSTTTSAISVSGAGTVADIAVLGLSIEHTYASDVKAVLVSPQGTRVELFAAVCGAGAWTAANTGFGISQTGAGAMGSVCPPGQGTYRPEEASLAPFVGQQAQGTWTLEVSDGGQYDVGKLHGWQLKVALNGASCGSVPSATSTATNTQQPTSTTTSIPTATGTATNTRTATATATATATDTQQPTNTAIPTSPATQTPVPTNTATPTSTNTVQPSSTATQTPLPPNTATSTATRTATASSTAQPPATGTATRTATRTATATATRTATKTATPTRTGTATRTATRTATPVAATPTRTPTSTSTPLRTPTQTPGTGGSCSAFYTSADVPRAIPDRGTTFSTLMVSDAGNIAQVEVRGLSLAHTYASDTTVFLISPQGARVELFSHRCGSNVWTQANTGFGLKQGASTAIGTTCPPGSGTYIPAGSLSAFAGQQANGTWKLEVNDTGAYDLGTLHAWSLWISYSNPTCPVGTQAHAGTPAPPTSTPNTTFGDVTPQSVFKPYLEWLASRGYISGYACGAEGEPCPGTYFRPSASVTRGQLLKMVVSATGWAIDNPKDSSFADVPRDSAFFIYIETAARRGIINGYGCGSDTEPCDEARRPYFRATSNITRGQLSKVLALALGLPAPAAGTQTFADVPEDSPFHAYVEAMAAGHIVGGYACGSAVEPCDDRHRPYFRPADSASRGQVAKFVAVGYGER